MMTSDEQGGTVSPPRLRLFFAAWPPAAAAAALYRYAAGIATTTGGPVQRAANLHAARGVLGDLRAAPQAAAPAVEALGAGLAHTLTAAGCTLERRRFAAHVTLIRDAGKPGKLPPLPEIDWPVAEFTLVRSAPFAG